MDFKSLLFKRSSNDAPLVAQTSFPIYLPLACLFFLQAKDLDITLNSSLTPSTEPLPTNPHAGGAGSSSVLFWINLHLSNFLSPPNQASSSLIWTKLFTLDLLLSFLHMAAKMISLRHKSDDGIAYLEELHGFLSSRMKFRPSYHDPQDLQIWLLFTLLIFSFSFSPWWPGSRHACIISLLKCANAFRTSGLWYLQCSIHLMQEELCKRAAYASVPWEMI